MKPKNLISELKKESKADIKESEFISLFPFDKSGEIAEILSLDTHFDDKLSGAKQILKFIINNLNKISVGSDILKAKEFLEQKKKSQSGQQGG